MALTQKQIAEIPRTRKQWENLFLDKLVEIIYYEDDIVNEYLGRQSLVTKIKFPLDSSERKGTKAGSFWYNEIEIETAEILNLEVAGETPFNFFPTELKRLKKEQIIKKRVLNLKEIEL